MLVYSPEIQTLLNTQYAEPGRYYHNINHIKFLLSKLDEWYTACKLTTQHTEKIYELTKHAIWWHDVIYSVWNAPGINEGQSAALFSEYYEQGKIPLNIYGIDSDSAANIIFLAISATSKHLVDLDLETGTDRLTDEVIKLMLDLDMSGFGKHYDLVAWNSAQVLAEYEPMGRSTDELLEGRILFLEKLLARKRIFYTNYFYETYEAQARKNITQSIMEAKDEPNEPESMFSMHEPTISGRSYSAGIAEVVHQNRNYFLNPNSGLKGYYLRGNPYLFDGYTLYYEDGSVWATPSLDWLVLE